MSGKTIKRQRPVKRRTTKRCTPSRFAELIAAGVIRPPLESGDPFEDWPNIQLAPGTAAKLINLDRGEA
jgi:hypothetical protein